jgi:hypothetical protein
MPCATPVERAPSAAAVNACGHVWFGTAAAASRLLASPLSATQTAELATRKSARRRQDWLVSRAVLQAATQAANVGQVGLAHSRGTAAVVTASEATLLAVDIEVMVERDFAAMARLAYSPAEAEFVSSVADPLERRSAFYELWTLKEASGKALGLDLLDALRGCTFIAGVGSTLAWRAQVPCAASWRAWVWAPRPDVRIAAFIGLGHLAAHPPMQHELPPVYVQPWRLVRGFQASAA